MMNGLKGLAIFIIINCIALIYYILGFNKAKKRKILGGKHHENK